MKLIIDAYNHLKRQGGPGYVSEAQRMGYANRLSCYLERKKKKLFPVYVVFDGGDLPMVLSQQCGGLEIVYAGVGSCADEWIVEHLTMQKGATLLVSSDAELQRRCRSSQVYPVKIEYFDWCVMTVLHHQAQEVMSASGPNKQLVYMHEQGERNAELDALMQASLTAFDYTSKIADEAQVDTVHVYKLSKKEKEQKMIQEMLL